MKRIIPRVRGKAVRSGAGWTWEAFVTIGNDPERIDFSSNKVFVNEESAIHDLRTCSTSILAVVCEKMGLGEPVDFIDLKEGTVITAKEFLDREPFDRKGDE